MEAINDMLALKETCRDEFESSKTAPSATQLQVSETLRHMGLLVEDEVRCPKSGYSIDMMVHDSGRGMGGERSSSTGTWTVEFDGPSHFLKSRAPTGATLLKRRHLGLLGHALVNVPYWEWEGCKGAGEREQYLRGKLAHFVQTPSHARHTFQANTGTSHHRTLGTKRPAIFRTPSPARKAPTLTHVNAQRSERSQGKEAKSDLCAQP
jgi:hypothetical protein